MAINESQYWGVRVRIIPWLSVPLCFLLSAQLILAQSNLDVLLAQRSALQAEYQAASPVHQASIKAKLNRVNSQINEIDPMALQGSQNQRNPVASISTYSPPTPTPTVDTPRFAPSPSPSRTSRALDGAANLVIQDGTPLRLRLSRTISSADAKVDDRIDFEVLEDIMVGEILVIQKGDLAWGTITEAQSKRRMARGGKLDVNIDSVRLVSGEKAALRAVKDVKGGGHTGAMTGAMVATAIVFWPAAPLFLFMHGKDITIPKGTEIAAYLNGDTVVDARRFLPKLPSGPQVYALEQSVPPKFSNVASIQDGSAVSMKSIPEGADIIIDGKFIGNTPSTIPMTTGDHAILIEKAGFRSWQRTIAVVQGSSVTVEATLEKKPE